MEALIQLVQALAWPVTTISLVLLLRAEIRQAARRLSTVAYKDIKAEFREDLVKIENVLAELTPPRQLTAVSESNDRPAHDRLLRIVELSPRAAVMEAWRDVEVTTKLVTDAYGVSVGGNIAGVKAINELARRGLVPKDWPRIYERLRRLRSRAAHAADFAIDPEEAERYVETAQDFYTYLRALVDNAKGTGVESGGA